MLPVTARAARLFLHVFGAMVWIGGQTTVAFLVPLLRRQGADVARAVARRFQVLAWSAYALLVATGIWNLLAVRIGDQSGEYLATVLAKLGLVAASGVAAAWHALLTAPGVTAAATDAELARRRALSGATGGLALLLALGAAFLGVLLRG